MQNIAKTLMSGFKALVNKKIRGSVADWNQNDTKADNYIKNRTHWEESQFVHEEPVPETTVTIDSDGGHAELKSCPKLTVGKIYTVILNGVGYQCVAREYNDCTLLGNGAIYGDGDESNGEPFAIDSYSNREIYLNVSTAGEYTISVSYSEVQTTIHKLDSKYLPDDIAQSPSVANEALNIARDNRDSLIEFDETVRTVPGGSNYFYIAYGAGKFVAVSGGGSSYHSYTAIYSEDGLRWKLVTLPASGRYGCYDLVFGNGRFLTYVGGGSSQLIYSDDGVNWKSTYLNSGNIGGIAFGDGKFIAHSYKDGKIYYSYDCETWDVAPDVIQTQYSSFLTYINNKFILIDTSKAKLAYSSDGISWSSFTTISTETSLYSMSYDGLFYVNGKYFLSGSFSSSGSQHYTYISTDLQNWESHPATDNRGIIGVTPSGRLIRSDLSYSTDGLNWNKTIATTEYFNICCSSNDTSVEIGYDVPYVAISTIDLTIATTYEEDMYWDCATISLIHDDKPIVQKIKKLLFKDIRGTGSLSVNRLSGSGVGDYSSTLGLDNTAEKAYSFAAGCNTIAPSDSCFTHGSYNASRGIYEDLGVSSKNRSINSINPNYYYYWSKEYTFDIYTGLYSLVNPIRVLGDDIYAHFDEFRDGYFVSSMVPAFIGKQMASDKYVSRSLYYINNASVAVKNSQNYITIRTSPYITSKLSSTGNSKYLHIVGNGRYQYDYDGVQRTFYSNAYTLDNDGTAWYQGDVYVGSDSGTNMDAGSRKLMKEPTYEETVNNLIEADLLPAIYTTSGAVLTDQNGNVVLRY